jgi:hypothetical protein
MDDAMHSILENTLFVSNAMQRLLAPGYSKNRHGAPAIGFSLLQTVGEHCNSTKDSS